MFCLYMAIVFKLGICVGLVSSHMGSHVLSFKYDMDAYMAIFLEVRLRTCIESFLDMLLNWVQFNKATHERLNYCQFVDLSVIIRQIDKSQ